MDAANMTHPPGLEEFLLKCLMNRIGWINELFESIDAALPHLMMRKASVNELRLEQLLEMRWQTGSGGKFDELFLIE